MAKHLLATTIVSIVTVSAVACNQDGAGNRDTSAGSGAAGDQRNGTQAAPITVTGCLQKEGRAFIVTRVNEPSERNVGTVGESAVNREQMRAAANAYRVQPEGDVDMNAMVGKQVRVTGTIKEAADLPGTNSVGSTTKVVPPDREADARADLDRGDLAQMRASAITTIADSCGTTPTGSTGTTGPDRTGTPGAGAAGTPGSGPQPAPSSPSAPRSR